MLGPGRVTGGTAVMANGGLTRCASSKKTVLRRLAVCPGTGVSGVELSADRPLAGVEFCLSTVGVPVPP
jgi:hypothetical protein